MERMKKIFFGWPTVMLCFLWGATANAAGLFGAPQTVSRYAGGLNTAVGYQYYEDVYENGVEHVIKQNQVYSQVAYGAKNSWEIYARFGISDLTLAGVFSSSNTTTVTGKSDFDENWKWFGTAGVKIFYPVNPHVGFGAFIQGTYHFSYFTDSVCVQNTGRYFETDFKVKNLWDVHGGLAVQVTLPFDIRLYGGPYVYYSEARVSLLPAVSALGYSCGSGSWQNHSIIGGYAGVDVPIRNGFRLNMEGKYSERFSGGIAISYTY